MNRLFELLRSRPAVSASIQFDCFTEEYRIALSDSRGLQHIARMSPDDAATYSCWDRIEKIFSKLS